MIVLKASVMFDGWYWPGMVVGSCMTMLTTWLLMRVFAFFQPHLAQALRMTGAPEVLCVAIQDRSRSPRIFMEVHSSLRGPA